jgi:hypothetical protein
MRSRSLGALLGALCAVHCLAVPLLFALAPGLQLALHQFGSTSHRVAQALLWSLALEPWLVGLALLSTGYFLWRRGPGPGWWIWALALGLMLTALSLRTSLLLHCLLLLGGSALLWWAPIQQPRSARSPDRPKPVDLP